MKFCANCGKELVEGKKFCGSCGSAVEVSAETPAKTETTVKPEVNQNNQNNQNSQTSQTQNTQGNQPNQSNQSNQTNQSTQINVPSGIGKLLNTPDTTGDYDPADIEKNKTMCGLAYFLFFLPLVACSDSKFGRYHANQGLLVLMAGLICGIVDIVVSIVTSVLYGAIFWRFPHFLTSFASLIIWLIFCVLWLAVAAMAFFGLINGFSGKAKELPIIGKIRIIK